MPWCLVHLHTDGTSTLLPNDEAITIGRNHDSTIVPSRSEHGVSATHAKIFFTCHDHPQIVDCSKHGTFLLPLRSFEKNRTSNKQRLEKGVPKSLTEDDVIILGGVSKRRLMENCCAYRPQRIGESSVHIQVISLCGALCDFESSACSSMAEIKDAIFQRCQIRVREQRLIFDTQELHDGAITLSSLLKDGQTSIVFTLIRRPTEQAEWLERVCNDGEQLKEAPPCIQADPDVVCAAARQLPKSFQFAAYALRSDREFALSVVALRRTAVRYVSDDLKQDENFLLAALERDAFVFIFVPRKLQFDDAFVLKAVHRNPFVLKYAGKYQSDRAVVVAAVSKKGSTLRYASEHLCDDREVVGAGLQQNRKVLMYASENLRAELSTTKSRNRHSSRSRSRQRSSISCSRAMAHSEINRHSSRSRSRHRSRS